MIRHRAQSLYHARKYVCRAHQLSVFNRLYSHQPVSTCVPVAIAGAGPTGLVLSSLLSQYGVQHMLLEKNAGMTEHPRAHYINNRTMEVLRGLPGLSQQVAGLSPPLVEWRRFIYCETMVSGQLLGEVDHFPGRLTPCDALVSPEPVSHLSQHHLVGLLLSRAQQLAQGVGASICFKAEVKSVSLVASMHQHHHQQQQQQEHQQELAPQPQQQSAHQPQQQQHLQAPAVGGPGGAHLDPAHTAALLGELGRGEYPVCVAVTQHGQQQQHQLVRCKYLVAADGSHSVIRRLLGIPMRGVAAMQHLISIHFSWPQLGQALLQRGREGMLYFVFNKQVVAVLVAHNLSRGEFVAQVPYFPPLQSPAQFTPELCQQLIEAAAGFTPQQQQQAGTTPAASGQAAGLCVHSIKDWVMSAEVAEEYGAWGNRVLLAGDASHRFPPAGGFGMNTGIQDAHNLAWKLAAVLHGNADSALLSSYQLERRPVAQANADLSVNNWHEAIRIPQALGLDPAAASLVNKVVSSAPLPQPVAAWLLDAALAAGRGLAQVAVPLRRGALQDILAAGLSLRLQFPKEDLGFVYVDGAVDVQHSAGQQLSAQQASWQQQQQQPDSTGVPASNSSSSSTRHSQAVGARSSMYEPAIVVGGRLPHCWLQLLEPEGSVSKVSTLDLCAPDRLGLNLLLLCTAGSSSSSSSLSSHQQDWTSAGLQLSAQGWPVKVLQVVPTGTDLQAAGAAGGGSPTCLTAADPAAAGVSCVVDGEGMWEQLHAACGGAAAVLVRPDGHIAWTSNGADTQHAWSSRDGSSSTALSTKEQEQVLLQVVRDVLHYRQQQERQCS